MKMMTLYKIIRSMPCFFKEVTHFYLSGMRRDKKCDRTAAFWILREHFYVIQPLYIPGVMFSMVYCRMDGKETDSQRDEEHEAEIVDVDFGSVYFFWICGDQKYTGVPVWI